MRIDSHHHLWDLEIAQRGWLAGEVLAPINRTFSMDDFYAERASAKIDKSILVQTLSDYDEMKEFFNVAANHESIVGVVAWIDTSKSDCFEKLETYLDLPGANKLVGIRDGAQGRTDTGWLSSDQVVKNVSQLVQEGLTFDLLVDPPHMAASAKLVKQCPDTTFILDHIGKPNIGKGDDRELKEWSNLIQNLAANQNVFCKVSGMVTEAKWDSWQNQYFKRYFDVILNSFGTERIMFGSDWPVCKLAASYDQVAKLAEFLVAELSATEKEKFWSLNAMKAYGI
jgi:L-fuconolactonase